MPRLAIGEQRLVGRDECGAQLSCRGHDHAVGWIGRQFSGQAGAGDRNLWREGCQRDSGQREHPVAPFADIAIERDTRALRTTIAWANCRSRPVIVASGPRSADHGLPGLSPAQSAIPRGAY